MITSVIFVTKQLIWCGECKENLHTDKLAWVKRVNPTWTGLFRGYHRRGPGGQKMVRSHRNFGDIYKDIIMKPDANII